MHDAATTARQRVPTADPFPGVGGSVAQRIALAFEFVVLFGGVPALLYFRLIPLPVIPTLLVCCVGCLAALMADPRFDRRLLWNAAGARPELARVALTFGVLAALLGLAVAIAAPESLFGFVRDRPRVWAVVMVLYPALSVYPQEIVYRAFLFHRYRALFRGRWVIIGASAAAFAYGHIVFENWMAVALTLVGGALFAWTYARTRSTLAAVVEHALFGCFIFTIGLGANFYAGGVGR